MKIRIKIRILTVAPRTGSVRIFIKEIIKISAADVAPRTGSVRIFPTFWAHILGSICRSPHGERAHIFRCCKIGISRSVSLPARGACAYFACVLFPRSFFRSLPARGACAYFAALSSASACRSPHGERGLKYCVFTVHSSVSPSLPARGAWIEILSPQPTMVNVGVAPRTGSVD